LFTKIKHSGKIKRNEATTQQPLLKQRLLKHEHRNGFLCVVFAHGCGPRANAELVPKFHVALHVSHVALPIVALEISLCTNVTLKYGDLALQVGGVSHETVKYGREFCGTYT
jgi:hypothetical protein